MYIYIYIMYYVLFSNDVPCIFFCSFGFMLFRADITQADGHVVRSVAESARGNRNLVIQFADSTREDRNVVIHFADNCASNET